MANGYGTAGGVYGKGSVNVNGSMSSQTIAQSDRSLDFSPTRISAGSTTAASPWLLTAPSNTITFEASADNEGTVTAYGGGGGLIGIGGGQATLVLSNPLTQASIGDFNIIDAPNALLQIIATATPVLQAMTTFTALGGITSNESDATAQVLGGQTLANLGKFVQITVDELSMFANDMWRVRECDRYCQCAL